MKRAHEDNNQIIAMAWADRISFEEIETKTGASEAEVIELMRRELKPGGFRRWRKRVSGRNTKHRKRWKKMRAGPGIDDD
ncbi:MAG: TIGR03643 family protein [Verrucomicrobiota bacterium]